MGRSGEIDLLAHRHVELRESLADALEVRQMGMKIEGAPRPRADEGGRDDASASISAGAPSASEAGRSPNRSFHAGDAQTKRAGTPSKPLQNPCRSGMVLSP